MKNIQEDIKTGNFKQAYLLYGEEAYLKQQYKHKLVQALKDKGGMRPDAILADYRLREGCTGVVAIQKVLDAFGEGIPAILVTGDTAPSRLKEAAASGYPILHKPVMH